VTLIIDNQPFPCICYIKELIKYEHIKIEKYDTFQKMTFRNRYIISGANGVMNLTIPLKGGREQKTLMKDVRIDNSMNWRIKHLRSLTSAYSNAPYFEFYYQDLQKLIFTKEEFLFPFNIKILDWLCNTLKIIAELGVTESFVGYYEAAADYRNYFLPKSFQKNEFDTVPHYSQVFEDRLGFQPNLSIIDLILCQGPNAMQLLKT
jgi:hypothetical protein